MRKAAGNEVQLMCDCHGWIELPTKPGLGIELDEDYLARHPWQGVKIWSGLRFADGGITDV